MPDHDLIIKGGMLFDGMRNPRHVADVAIRDGRISEIGTLRASDAARVIDAEGLHVAPGFIDLHTHYDSQLFWDPYCSSSGWHGVTSLVVGNCGFGFAPVAPEDREAAMRSMTRTEAIPLQAMRASMPWDWVSFPEFLASLERTPKAVNVGALVPLTPLLSWTMGLERAKAGELPTAAEHHEMRRLLHEAMDAGACGFSAQHNGMASAQRDFDGTPMVTDLMHRETLVELGSVLAERNEGFIEYFNEHDREAVEALAAASGRPIVWNSIMTTSRDPQRHRREILWLRSCRDRGLRIHAQGLISAAGLVFAVADEFGAGTWDQVEAWREATLGTVEEKLAKLSDPSVRARMKEHLPATKALPDLGEWVLYRGKTPASAQYNEVKLKDIARATGKDLVDAFCDVVVADELRTEFYVAGLNTDRRLLKELIDEPDVLAGVSDGGAHTKYSTLGRYTTEYLTDFVRDSAWLSLEEAHWRLSAYPAHCAGFQDRGTIRVGAAADVIIYDYDELAILPEEVLHDTPGDEWRRVQRARGYRWVLVNGEVTIEDDVPTEARPGVSGLRSGAATPTPIRAGA